jgi:hypothetical protein
MDGLSVVTLSPESYFDVISCQFRASSRCSAVMGGACGHGCDPCECRVGGFLKGVVNTLVRLS